MAADDEFILHLTEFGLGEKEAQMYLHLLEYGLWLLYTSRNPKNVSYGRSPRAQRSYRERCCTSLS